MTQRTGYPFCPSIASRFACIGEIGLGGDEILSLNSELLFIIVLTDKVMTDVGDSKMTSMLVCCSSNTFFRTPIIPSS